jgi:sugar (pentulose or hexulose) kinase
MSGSLVIGMDLGTSGARAVVADTSMTIVAQSASPLSAHGANPRDPAAWWSAVQAALAGVLRDIDRSLVRAIAVDATSGTVLPVDAAGTPLAEPLMYNDAVPDAALLEQAAQHIPLESAAHGETSGLAKALYFQDAAGIAGILHQADWIAGKLCGQFDWTDANNALKTGYDPVAGRWPHWIEATGIKNTLLPRVLEPGQTVAAIAPAIATHFDLPQTAVVVAGTTDGCASFLATGADKPGDGVTALGSTLTLKLLSDKPIFAPDYGIYSHKVLGMWLAGGASNTGGKVLASFFDAPAIAELSSCIDADRPTGLDYYPLQQAGERFPLNDPRLAPRLDPRPADDRQFLQGLLEGIASIEALGYRRLSELGAPTLRSMRSVGGGAANPAWTAIRQRKLNVPFENVHSGEAAAGAARLALAGLHARAAA